MNTNKRQRIINAAVALFSRTHDFRRVSLETVAAEAHVSPTTIYNNFGKRETLVNEVIKNLVCANLDCNRALIHSGLPFQQKLAGIIGGKVGMSANINQEIIEKLILQDKTIAPFIEEVYVQEIKPLWKEMLADGKKHGYIDPALDDEALLAYLDVLQAGFKARPELLQGFKENPAFIRQLTRLMCFGFLTKDIDLFPHGREGAR
jgi:AcrR family transcriptional regulator